MDPVEGHAPAWFATLYGGATVAPSLIVIPTPLSASVQAWLPVAPSSASLFPAGSSSTKVEKQRLLYTFWLVGLAPDHRAIDEVMPSRTSWMLEMGPVAPETVIVDELRPAGVVAETVPPAIESAQLV